MLNETQLIGRLTRDPELKHTQSDIAICNFTLAVERDHAGSDGARETDFIDVVAWRGLAEFVSRYFVKGMLAVVVGRIQTQNWTDKSGGRRKSVSVVASKIQFGETKKARGIASGSSGQAAPQSVPAVDYDLMPNDGADFQEIADGEVPF